MLRGLHLLWFICTLDYGTICVQDQSLGLFVPKKRNLSHLKSRADKSCMGLSVPLIMGPSECAQNQSLVLSVPKF